MRKLKISVLSFVVFLQILAFQNCAKDINVNDYSDQASLGTPPDPGPAPQPPTPPPLVVPPTIISQSSSPTLTEGQGFTLTVNVQGDAPVFTWSHNGGVIPGAVGASYGVASATASHSGAYRVTATNSAGQAVADFAVTVNVAPPPPPQPVQITMQPAPTLSTVTINNTTQTWSPSTVTLSVGAIGTDVRYQWYHRGSKYGSFTPPEVPIAGATGPSHVVQAVYGNAMSAFCGAYRVVVSNNLNTISSNSVTVRCSAGGNFYQ